MAFTIIRDDITRVYADAIVNTANPKPVIGGGTDTAIYQAAGSKELLAERKKIGDIAPGCAAHTPAFGLDAKYIIHTVGPVWEGGDAGEYEILASCYRNSLMLAHKLGCTSVAFPLISTGVYGFPKDKALKIAMNEFRAYLDASEDDMEIRLVVFDRESFVLSGNVFDGVDAFVDGNYVEEKLDTEYATDGADEDYSVTIAGKERSGRFANIFRAGKRPVIKKAARSCENMMEKSAVPEEECMMAQAAPAAAARSLDDVMKQVGETWQESLLRLIDEKGYKDSEVYKKANIDRKLFSKIRSNTAYQPKKVTAVAFALALELNLDETKDFLGRAGYAFSPGNKGDLIIEYFIQNGIHDTYTINLALFDHDQPLIGA